jgi:hypothetical protein
MTGEVRASEISPIDDLLGGPPRPAPQPEAPPASPARPQTTAPAGRTSRSSTPRTTPRARARPRSTAAAAQAGQASLPPGLEPEEPKKVQTGTYLYEPTSLRLNAFIAKMKAQGNNVTKLRVVDAAIQEYLDKYDPEG